MSYSLYLIHAPVIHLVWLGVARLTADDAAQFLLLLPAGLAASLLVTALFFPWFEAPFSGITSRPGWLSFGKSRRRTRRADPGGADPRRIDRRPDS
jgi:peptidoglycan/LPS O-acetylase OafA/YrhL